ncbi:MULTISPECIES: hypothetical protein [unclassified Epibacterium]|uniref:hypothetical protein n=1 Tax=unclassified Epibacterium TaxID=2639179 RepID=UPI001EF440BE|nr:MULTISPECIES: hypothetical protein [unclassified Epibacterium]MCG7624343.1 hypothetical protein [Epibacterium sp. Ofav1-8]MCG7629194.1 hypothetical protein [Epibacterium sp. MM17-32]
MVCFCKDLELPMALPSTTRDSLRVDAPPPQLSNMLKLMKLNANLSARTDLNLAEMLPQDQNWMAANIVAQAPNGTLPSDLPSGGGPVLALAARLAVPAALFPLDDLEALKEELTQAILSLEENVMAQTRSLPPQMPQPSYQHLALGAHMTLALRAQGLCPFEVMEMELNESAALGDGGTSLAKQNATLQFASRLPKMRLPAFGLPPAQLKLATQLAGLASSTAALNKPPLTPAFIEQLKSQYKALQSFPVPRTKTPLPILMALAAEMADLDVIHEAFGEDALTPAGQSRINAMYTHWAKKRIAVPLPAAELQSQFEMLPEVQDVLEGGRVTKSSGPGLMASMSTQMPPPPVTPVLEVIAALGSVMTKLMRQKPFGACSACDFAA